MKKTLFHITLTAITLLFPLIARAEETKQNSEDFVIKKPGEITFTSGLVIEGRVEKPQVLLILTKEKIKMPQLNMNSSMLRFVEEAVKIE